MAISAWIASIDAALSSAGAGIIRMTTSSCSSSSRCDAPGDESWPLVLLDSPRRNLAPTEIPLPGVVLAPKFHAGVCVNAHVRPALAREPQPVLVFVGVTARAERHPVTWLP